jgi:hypothetical protein
MLKSFIAEVVKGQIILKKEILGHLGIGSNGRMYGALNTQEKSVVLSPIPPKYWENAYKIIVHTSNQPGSYAAAANAIAKLKLNTISSWASTESKEGHLCTTSIVVGDNKNLSKIGSEVMISDKIKDLMRDKLSDLNTFNSNLFSIRVTPLSILSAYRKELGNAKFHSIEIDDNYLLLNQKQKNNINSLWHELLAAGGISRSSTCILSPDTEEAFLRVIVVPESARLYHLSFLLSIKSSNKSFEGYWQNALNLIAQHEYSIYMAHNLLTKKSEKPAVEESEFHFVLDCCLNNDIKLSQDELRKEWQLRFEKSFHKLAKSRHGQVKVLKLRLSQPKGIGVPCFFATNAKAEDAVNSKTALKICKILEGHGFKPVNVDIAKGSEVLAPQVISLVETCRFMVVLNCPEERLKISNDLYRVSEWVLFEEALMTAQKGEIIRLRFENVIPPSSRKGYVEAVLLNSGFTYDVEQDFINRLERWTKTRYRIDDDNINAVEIPDDILDRDLAAYFGGRK